MWGFAGLTIIGLWMEHNWRKEVMEKLLSMKETDIGGRNYVSNVEEFEEYIIRRI